MDFVTSSRLAALRKEHGYSQEALAAEIGVSRQAVSKWERAESSPDTDNLTALASLYGMTLDALLNGEQKEPEAEGVTQEQDGETVSDDNTYSDNSNTQDGSSSSESGKGQKSTAPKEAVKKEGFALARQQRALKRKASAEKARMKNNAPPIFPKAARFLIRFPFFVVVIVAFVLTGYYTAEWNVAWLIFLTLPIWYGFYFACRAKTKRGFLLLTPVLFIAVLIFLTSGVVFGVWHPTWLVFLAVPAFLFFAIGAKK